MKKYLSILFILFMCINTMYSQQQTDTLIYISYPISGTEITVKIPTHYTVNSNQKNEYSCSQKGIVLSYILIPNITTKQFCDSLTPTYFSNQNLQNIQHIKKSGISIYTGSFMINDIPYFRAFYVYPYKRSTLLGIFNYPQVFADETEQLILHSLNTCNHD